MASTRFTFCLFLVLFWTKRKAVEKKKIKSVTHTHTRKEDECLKKSRSHYDRIPYILHKNKLTGILMGTSENLCTGSSLSFSLARFATWWLSSNSDWSRMIVQYVVQSIRKSNATCIPISINLRLTCRFSQCRLLFLLMWRETHQTMKQSNWHKNVKYSTVKRRNKTVQVRWVH